MRDFLIGLVDGQGCDISYFYPGKISHLELLIDNPYEVEAGRCCENKALIHRYLMLGELSFSPLTSITPRP